MPLFRSCSKCHREFPATTEFWYSAKGNECKRCAIARIAAWRAAHPETVRIYHERAKAKVIAERNGESVPKIVRPIPTHQVCAVCRRDFPLSPEFWYTQTNNRSGFGTHCKPCWRKRSMENYESMADSDREKLRVRNRQFYAEHKEAANARTAKYRARRKAGGVITQFDVGVQFAKQDSLCFYCRKSIADRKFDVDHYVPLSKGGTNTPDNIVLACPTCNASKRAKLPADFKPKSASI